MNWNYHRPSGLVRPSGFVKYFLTVPLLMCLGCALNVTMTHQSPFDDWMFFALVIAHWVAVGRLTPYLAQRFEFRSPIQAAGIALLGGLLSYYFLWAFHFIWRMGLPWAAWSIAFRPVVLLEHARQGFVDGFWIDTTTGAPLVNGAPLAAFWLVEFTALVFVPAFLVYRRLTRAVYCENCQCWLTFNEFPRWYSLDSGAVLLQALEHRDWTELEKATDAPDPEVNGSVRIRMACCEKCAGAAVLSVDRIKFVQRGLWRSLKQSSLLSGVVI